MNLKCKHEKDGFLISKELDSRVWNNTITEISEFNIFYENIAKYRKYRKSLNCHRGPVLLFQTVVNYINSSISFTTIPTY